MNDISITLNGVAQTIEANSSLAELIAQTGVAPETLSTAVNGGFVARTDRARYLLQAGDAVFTFQAITGG